jgi:ADP-ribose pyrophosphatase YjhB (NUDIX family)
MGKSIEILARGLIRHRDRVLTCRSHHGHSYLPGGRVRFQESAVAALSRELREETGLQFRIGSHLATVENFFESVHELNLIFEAAFPVEPDESPFVPSQETDISFHWQDIHRLSILPLNIGDWIRCGAAPTGFRDSLGSNSGR